MAHPVDLSLSRLLGLPSLPLPFWPSWHCYLAFLCQVGTSHLKLALITSCGCKLQANLFGVKFTKVATLMSLGSSLSWKENLFAHLELIMEDDKEDDFNLNLVLGLGLDDEGVHFPRI
jgi:hypothetical protein